MNLVARDCSPFNPQPTRQETEWLKRVQIAVRPSSHVIGLGDEYDGADDEPIVYAERDGTWWAGRFVGSLVHEGRSLTILPRFGMETLRSWLSQAMNVALVGAPGALRDDESFIVQLLALVWSRSLVDAARHGLPSERRDQRSTGTVVRGRLEVARSVRSLASGGEDLAFVRQVRSLDNAASRAIVAAGAILRRMLGAGNDDRWLPTRARDIMSRLQAATGRRPQLPSRSDLQRTRYSPITMPFRRVAELSWNIASRRGLLPHAAAKGECEGVLLDVAELWELYVLAALRRAASGCEVCHGTRDSDARGHLLESAVDRKHLGTLMPDAVVRRGRGVIGILDAKYKRLAPTARHPSGAQREDLYQLAAYVAHYGRAGEELWGVLAYPSEGGAAPPAETRSPWVLDPTRRVFLISLPHDIEAATRKLRSVLPLQRVGAPTGDQLRGRALAPLSASQRAGHR